MKTKMKTTSKTKMHNWLQRSICGFLAVVLLFGLVPPTAFAQKPATAAYGDVNADGAIDVKDVLLLQKHLLNVKAENFQKKYADVNADGQVDLKDLLNIKKYIVGYDIQLGPDKEEDKQSTVSFYDGTRLIEKLQTATGEPLGKTPSNEKTSKADGIFMGWYTDPEFKTPYYADAPVTKSINVYAKYQNFDEGTLTVTSFAQVDLGADAAFTVVGTGDTTAITLTPMDGSDPVELAVTGKGPYTVKAVGGFTEGASYQMTLPEGLNFVGTNGKTMPETVRTASFTIKKEAVNKVQFSDNVKYLQHADPSKLKEGAKITVKGAAVGDLLCFYKNTSPADRDYVSGNAYMDDPETWFKVKSVSGDKVVLAKLEETDNQKMYDVPDNFPIQGALPKKDTGTLTLAKDSDGYTLDTDFYGQMLEKAEDATLENALKKLNVGDFISIYANAEQIDEEADIFFGKITAIKDGKITYIKSSAEEISKAADLYVEPVVKGDDILSEESKEQIEETVKQQLADSNFAEEAAYMLADLATKTDGFKNMEGVQAMLTGKDGQPLSDDQLALLGLGASFELSDDVELTVELITSGDKLHFKDKGAVQLSVGVDATFKVEAEEGEVVIDLSAVFTQELAIGVTANGSLVKKKILFIPVPIGVKIGASVDLLSYTAVRVDVHGYTVGEEEKTNYETLMDVMKNPEKLADVVSKFDGFEEVAEGLKTVGDLYDKIEELEGKVEQCKDDVNTLKGYQKDVAKLWELAGQLNTDKKMTKDEWKQMGKALGKTNISKDLMDMMGLTTETGLESGKYAEGLNGLMEKYSEMLEKETDWVTLVEKELVQAEVNVLGLVIYCKADFLVHADMNIAMGASFQYQVGKRYSFWFKIGLFKPQAGSTTMDLVDEFFAFQFYVMGKLGLKMGIKATVGFAIGSADLARVGLSLEMGPYVKLYGFFIYEYERWREANTTEFKSKQNMAGALYVDIGLYLVVAVDAAALGDLFSVEYAFVDEEFPLLEIGNKKYPYQFHYEPMEGELVLVADEDKNSKNGIMMELPDEYRALSYCDLPTGNLGAQAWKWENYFVTFSNPAFSMDKEGNIQVDVPANTRYMECDLTLTYKHGKMAFSTYDMQVVIPLVWTNLATDELTQYYTASVRVGNAEDGYTTVWSKRVRKNQEFTLPTEEELTKLMGYKDYIYSSMSYPDAGKKVKIIANTSYDCEVTYTDYAITVSGIQAKDGKTYSKVFHTTYGNTFDFSALNGTGTSKAGTVDTAKYTKFIGVTTNATVTASGQTKPIDLSQPITGKVAEAILAGKVKGAAQYGDNSILVTYSFTGIDTPDVVQRVAKGTVAAYDIHTVAANKGMAVKSVSPKLGKVNTSTTFQVTCGQITGPKYTLSFQENGGTAVTDIQRVGGSLIGNIPTPTRKGHTFGGWYTDAKLTKAFSAELMPKKNVTLYAKWTAKKYTVTLHVNGGNAWDKGQGTAKVTYGATYGTLATPVRDGYAFLGWYSTKECKAGTEVTAKTKVTITGKQTLYAKWHKLVQIEGKFTYTTPETNYIYRQGTQVKIQPDKASWPVAPKGAPELKQDSFTIKFMRQGDSEYAPGYPEDAGTYDVTISRPADSYYAAFSQTITGILTIEKATRTVGKPALKVSGTGFSTLTLKLAKDAVKDLHPDATIIFQVEKVDGEEIITGFGGIGTGTAEQGAKILGLHPNTEYAARITIRDDPNYVDVIADSFSPAGKTAAAPTDSWKNHTEPIEFQTGVTEYTITTPGQLAYLALMVNTGDNYTGAVRTENDKQIFDKFLGYTFKLGADIDLSAYAWEPICGDVVYKKVTDYVLVVGGTKYPQQKIEYTYPRFAATFDGNGYTVSGMYIDGNIAKEASGKTHESSTNNAAMFGFLSKDAHITNVKLTNAYVSGTKDVAALVSVAEGQQFATMQIDNCYSEATVIGSDCYTGGIAAKLYNCDLLNCVSKGRVQQNTVTGGDGISCGGIVAYLNRAKAISCVNYAEVVGTEDIGGIAGYLSTYSRVADSVNFGNVTGTSSSGDDNHFGGIAGYLETNNAVANCANYGNISAKTDCVGGITGEHARSSLTYTLNCVSYGKVSGKKYVGAVIGRNYKDEGQVDPVFYQIYAGGPYAAGTEKGSGDDIKNIGATPFETADSLLLDQLNAWGELSAYEGSQWVKNKTGIGYIPESVSPIINGK